MKPLIIGLTGPVTWSPADPGDLADGGGAVACTVPGDAGKIFVRILVTIPQEGD